MQDSTDIQQEILSRVDLVAQKFSEIAPEAWEILVRQQIIEGTVGMIGFVIVVSLLGLLTWGAARRDWDMDALVPLFLITGLAAGVLGIYGLTEFIPQLLNPEYYALMELKP